MKTKVYGAYLVVGVPGPVNVALQSGPRAKVFLTHIDKVKAYTGSQTPRSWVSGESTSQPSPKDVSEKEEGDEGESGPSNGAESSGLGDAEGVGDVYPGQVTQWLPPLTVPRSPLPKRNAPIPARYRD